MRIKVFLSKTMAILLAVFVIGVSSTVVFALNDTEIQENNLNNSEYSIQTVDRYYNDYEDDEDKPDMAKVIGIGLVFSIVVTAATIFFIYRSYKTNGMTEPYPYNQKAPLQLTDAEDRFVDKTVVKIKIKTDSK